MKLLHSADWQLGARFAQFGEHAERLRQARLATLRRALDVARENEVDAFLIAGDLFESNHVDNAVVSAALAAFCDFPDVPVFILPGNHDPHSGPGSVWTRRSFVDAPKHVAVFREAQRLELGGAYLLASPLGQKVSTVDPSLKLDELARDLPPDGVRIGITHGALAIPGKHQPNDFPIDLAAATRAGLDYLAVGHWHEWQVYDQGRLVMPGTPEPDSFDRAASGRVALVEVPERGVIPKVEPVQVAGLNWQALTLDALDGEAGREALGARLEALLPAASTTVLRLCLAGAVSPQALEETRAWLKPRLEPFPICLLVDQTTLVLSEAELQQLHGRHPILAEVLADLDQMAVLFAGSRPGSASPAQAVSFAEAERLLADARIDTASLTTAHFNLARQLLLQKYREVGG
jgi:DNA repair exonuclease SbcCD nuclease subunit